METNRELVIRLRVYLIITTTYPSSEFHPTRKNRSYVNKLASFYRISGSQLLNNLFGGDLHERSMCVKTKIYPILPRASVIDWLVIVWLVIDWLIGVWWLSDWMLEWLLNQSDCSIIVVDLPNLSIRSVMFRWNSACRFTLPVLTWIKKRLQLLLRGWLFNTWSVCEQWLPCFGNGTITISIVSS